MIICVNIRVRMRIFSDIVGKWFCVMGIILAHRLTIDRITAVDWAIYSLNVV
jgi:hypothetical protein